MADDLLRFHCSACDQKLKVPRRLAGVVGPCPNCGSKIRAPQSLQEHPATVTVVRESPDWPPPDSLPEHPTPLLQVDREQGNHHPTPNVPRQDRPSHLSNPRRESPFARNLQASPARRTIARWALAILTLLGLAAAGVAWQQRGKPPAPASAAPRPSAASSARVAAAADAPDPPTPVRDSGTPVGSPSPPPPTRAHAPAPIVTPETALRRFLGAASLDERKSWCLQAGASTSWRGTFLDRGPLPVLSIQPETPIRPPGQAFTDHLFTVQPRSNPRCLVILRHPENAQPKVLVQPMLDIWGNRLAAFASDPDRPVADVFQAVVEPHAGCSDPDIPAADRKITYSLRRSTQFGDEITRAYADKDDPDSKSLDLPQSTLRWGKRVPATFEIRWNRNEDPAHPYLEMVRILRPNWDP